MQEADEPYRMKRVVMVGMLILRRQGVPELVESKQLFAVGHDLPANGLIGFQVQLM